MRVRLCQTHALTPGWCPRSKWHKCPDLAISGLSFLSWSSRYDRCLSSFSCFVLALLSAADAPVLRLPMVRGCLASPMVWALTCTVETDFASGWPPLSTCGPGYIWHKYPEHYYQGVAEVGALFCSGQGANSHHFIAEPLRGVPVHSCKLIVCCDCFSAIMTNLCDISDPFSELVLIALRTAHASSQAPPPGAASSLRCDIPTAHCVSFGASLHPCVSRPLAGHYTISAF